MRVLQAASNSIRWHLLHGHRIRITRVTAVLCRIPIVIAPAVFFFYINIMYRNKKEKQQQRNEVNKWETLYSHKYMYLSHTHRCFWAIWHGITDNFGAAKNWAFADPSTRNTASDTEMSLKPLAPPKTTRQGSGEPTLLATWARKCTHTHTKARLLKENNAPDPFGCLDARCDDVRGLHWASRSSTFAAFTEAVLSMLATTNWMANTRPQTREFQVNK